jgi:hypothetical protein
MTDAETQPVAKSARPKLTPKRVKALLATLTPTPQITDLAIAEYCHRAGRPFKDAKRLAAKLEGIQAEIKADLTKSETPVEVVAEAQE